MNLKTRFRSLAMRRFSSASHLENQRHKARKQREKTGTPPVVHYFHQVDDPYSHLSVQKLDQLRARYQIKFQPHLTSAPSPAFQGSAQHFNQWALRDALSIAADYQTEFPPAATPPALEQVRLANTTLAAHLNRDDFATTAIAIGHDLWAGTPNASTDSRQPAHLAEQAVQAGNRQRNKFGHYQGAMFYFEGEWFWGVDRIRLLEQRLSDEGFDSEPGPLCVAEPTPRPLDGKSVAGIVLEYFPSLRSPYTAIGHSRVLDLVERTGVRLEVRPVMPMLMRGIPAPRAKQSYIITDSGREGRAHGCPLGKIVDPFGSPVLRAFALFPGAQSLGLAMPFVTAYLQAAWFKGIDITREEGLKRVAANAGIDWPSLQKAAAKADWQAVLADNLAAMDQEHLWGVPSFRVSGGHKHNAYACWGQDRIWRVANEIESRC